jgi:hypothetical protein
MARESRNGHLRSWRHRWPRTLVWLAVPVGIAAGVSVATVASAASGPQGERVVPEGQVLEVDAPVAWAKAVTESKLALPQGQSYPRNPPKFFDGISESKNEAYAASLFPDFVGLYSYCSWLAVDIAAKQQGDDHVSSLVAEQIDAYLDSLGSQDRLDRESYLKQLDSSATAGTLIDENAVDYSDVNEFVYSTECTGFETVIE